MSATVKIPKAKGAIGVLPNKIAVVIPKNIHQPCVLYFEAKEAAAAGDSLLTPICPLGLDGVATIGVLGLVSTATLSPYERLPLATRWLR